MKNNLGSRLRRKAACKHWLAYYATTAQHTHPHIQPRWGCVGVFVLLFHGLHPWLLTFKPCGLVFNSAFACTNWHKLFYHTVSYSCEFVKFVVEFLLLFYPKRPTSPYVPVCHFRASIFLPVVFRAACSAKYRQQLLIPLYIRCKAPSTVVDTILHQVQSTVNSCWNHFTSGAKPRQQLLIPLCACCNVL